MRDHAVSPDPVTAAVAALIEHDATCSYCATALPGDPRCAERADLAAATTGEKP